MIVILRKHVSEITFHSIILINLLAHFYCSLLPFLSFIVNSNFIHPLYFVLLLFIFNLNFIPLFKLVWSRISKMEENQNYSFMNKNKEKKNVLDSIKQSCFKFTFRYTMLLMKSRDLLLFQSLYSFKSMSCVFLLSMGFIQCIFMENQISQKMIIKSESLLIP